LFLSNWLTSIIGLAVTPQLARFTVVPAYVLVPVITVLLILAAVAHRGSFDDLLLTAVFGVAGYAMKIYGWPRVSLVIALVLAALFENNLHLTLRLIELGRIDPIQRPLALLLVGLLLGMVSWSIVRSLRARAGQERA
jgi:putative tricarboxylic transport membrane protein